MDVLFLVTLGILIRIIILHIWISLHCGISSLASIGNSVSSWLSCWIGFGLSWLSLCLNKGLIHHSLLNSISLCNIILSLNIIQILNILRIYFSMLLLAVVIHVLVFVALSLCFLGFLEKWHPFIVTLLSRLKCCSWSMAHLVMLWFLCLAGDSLMAISTVSIKEAISIRLKAVGPSISWCHTCTPTLCSISMGLMMMLVILP